MHVCMYARMHVCTYACMHVLVYACMHASMYVWRFAVRGSRVLNFVGGVRRVLAFAGSTFWCIAAGRKSKLI